MTSRLNARAAACLLALTLIGAFATASIRMDAASLQMSAASPELAAAAGIDIPALTATASGTYLPLLSVHDPI